jgi:formate dehydrogenase maturation protein FdhE
VGRSDTAMSTESTERNYNLEFCEALLKHPRVEHPQLFDLLSVAEELIGEKIWLVEEAIWEVVNIPEVQVSEEEREHLKKLIADLKEKHTAEVLATVERVAKAFNPSLSEDEIQTVIQNAINTSNIKVVKPKEKIPIIKNKKPIKDEGIVKEESEGQLEGADVFQNWLNTLG